jgi:hypothetical protein
VTFLTDFHFFADADDDEVSDINRSQGSSNHIDAESRDHSAKLNDPQLTAQSMQQFMKNVNRIRFNSMNTNNDSTIKRSLKRRKRVRSSSCPDFQLKSEDAIANDGSLDEAAEDVDISDVTEIVSEESTVTGTERLPSSFPGGVAVTCESTMVTRSTTVHHIYPRAPLGVVQSLPHMSHGLAPPSRVPPFIDMPQTARMPLRRLPYEDLFPYRCPSPRLHSARIAWTVRMLLQIYKINLPRCYCHS